MSEILDKYEPIIGLEVHAQMKTKSKAFCSCSTEFNAPPNTNTCPICLGHPGTLPVLNKNLVEFILRMGIATNCIIRERSIFARKNYFYPDLPKGYQISQYDQPICHDGYVEISGKKIGITRIHMEEDSGKSIHDFHDSETLLDLNRCGVPLIEIVSKPDLNSAEEAIAYLKKIRQLLIYLMICDGNMEEGSIRCDVNISVRQKGETYLAKRTEIKNMNSFKAIHNAIVTVFEKKVEALEEQETNMNVLKYNFNLKGETSSSDGTVYYDLKIKDTVLMRSKEEAHDYRYFPEPDLVTVHIDEAWKKNVMKSLPELPAKRSERFIKEYSIPEYDAKVLSQEKAVADYFEAVCSEIKGGNFKAASNWVMTEIMRVLKENKIEITEFWVKPANISSLINLIAEGKISNNIAKEVYQEMLKLTNPDDEKQRPEHIVKEKSLLQVSDTSEIEKIINKILEENPAEVARYKSGEIKLLGFFVGKIMKESKGKANPKTVNELLSKSLG
jgi:aspartyl-tRNA(Asn)/glutamyl-tRNA(Gln) amidotransferase subunit B